MGRGAAGICMYGVQFVMGPPLLGPPPPPTPGPLPLGVPPEPGRCGSLGALVALLETSSKDVDRDHTERQANSGDAASSSSDSVCCVGLLGREGRAPGLCCPGVSPGPWGGLNDCAASSALAASCSACAAGAPAVAVAAAAKSTSLRDG